MPDRNVADMGSGHKGAEYSFLRSSRRKVLAVAVALFMTFATATAPRAGVANSGGAARR